MRLPATIGRSHVLAAVALSCIAASWTGCATGNTTSNTSGAGGSSLTLSTATSGQGGFSGTGGGGGSHGCTYTDSEKATPVPLDQASAYFNLAQAYFAAGQRDQAEDSVLESLEAAPGFRPAQKLLLQIKDASAKGDH